MAKNKKTIELRAHELLDHATNSRKSAKNWIELFNAVFGIGGKFSQLFPTQTERVHVSKLEPYKQIWKLIGDLRDAKGDPAAIEQTVMLSNGKLSVRIPASLHAALLAEAEAEGVSLNQLCSVKLAVQLRSATTTP